MEFLITEKQFKILIENQEDSSLSNHIKKMYSFTHDMVKRVSEVYGLNLRMLLTWATSVGGFVMPLDEYIKSGDFNLNEDQRMLILSGVVFMIFFESKKLTKDLIDIIKKENLESEFKKTLSKMNQLKKAFESFLETVKSTSSIFLETIAYSFLIPIITDIMGIIDNSTNINKTIETIVNRLLATGLILVSRDILISIIKKILKRFR